MVVYGKLQTWLNCISPIYVRKPELSCRQCINAHEFVISKKYHQSQLNKHINYTQTT